MLSLYLDALTVNIVSQILYGKNVTYSLYDSKTWFNIVPVKSAIVKPCSNVRKSFIQRCPTLFLYYSMHCGVGNSFNRVVLYQSSAKTPLRIKTLPTDTQKWTVTCEFPLLFVRNYDNGFPSQILIII